MTSKADSSSSRPTLVLASQSPRRASLLQEAGLHPVIARSAFVDDPAPPQGQESLLLAVELATKKAINVIVEPQWHQPVVIGADTISVAVDGSLLGQPQSRAEARQMIESFMDHTHHMVTGVALWSPVTQQQEVFADTAEVWMGRVSDDVIDAYLDTELWRGKAGGYSLAHLQEQQWPLRVGGDETTVLGLPMRRLLPRLAAWGIEP